MSYEKQNFVSGQTLTAAHLNHMEEGIVEAEKTGGTAELTIGTVTTGNTAAASITEGRLNLTLPKGEKGDNGTSSVLTPEQFGAVGDGVTDDRTALQTAINKAAETRVPLELRTGATYLCKEYLELPNNCTLHGNGAVILSELTYEKLGADRPFICITGESNTVWKHDIKIDGLTIRATDNCQCNTMFRVMRARDISITNCLFDCDINEQNRGCMDLYGAYENILIQKVVFRQLTAGEAGGIWVRNWKSDVPCKNVRFLNCDFYKAGGDEVLGVWGWCGILKDVLISGCNFYDVDDEKYVSRGHYPVYGITLGQTGLRTDVRMENCFVRMNWCETLFRVTGDNTHTIVNNCDIYSDQPEGMGEHDPNSAACAMLAFGNGDKFHSVFSNNRIHFRGDRNRKICYKAGALRNNYFDVELGNGPAGCAEVVGNVFKGKFARQLFNDCGVIRDNIIEAEVIAPGLFSGAGIVENNQYTLTITGYNQGASVFGNNWGSGTIRNNKIEMNCTSTEPYGIRKYIFPSKNTIPEYIEGNIVTIAGNVEYDSPHMASIFGGVVYRRNNYFNGIPERLFECTGVTFAHEKIVEQYKKRNQLAVDITPVGCTDPVIYTWNNADGAVVDMGDGQYHPVRNGKAYVTINCGMFSATQEIDVELVPAPCTALRLSRSTALCAKGKTTYLKAFITPYWTTDDTVWSSDAEDIAVVSQDGEVTALATGTANITVTCGSYSAVCKLSVVEANHLPAYTEGEWLLDNTVAYVPMPDMEEEHTLYASFDVDTSCVDAREEVVLISSLLSGQQGQESVRLGFGADSTGYKTIRWMTTDITADDDGNTTCYKVDVANAGFKDGEPASSGFLYLKKGIANQGGSVIWTSTSSKVKPAPDSGYLTLNVQTDAADKPVSNYSTGTALQAALTSGNIHATKATGFRLKELILFTNSSYETLADIKKYRENAEIDLRFDAEGNPVNAGTAGDFVIAGKDNPSVVPVSGIALDKTTLSMKAEGTETLTATVLPVNATDKTVYWTVSPEDIVTLSVSTGSAVTISATKAGNCTVTAAAGGQSAECAVTVTAADTSDTDEPTPVFSLPETNFIPENATVVDTGIKLFESADGAKDYTIIISQKPNSTATTGTPNKYCLLHCMDETDPYPGLSVAVGTSSYGISVFTQRERHLLNATVGFNTFNDIVFAIRFSGKRVWVKSYCPNTKNYTESKGWVDITDYTAVDKSLLIGGYQESDGTKGRFWDGTVYFCKIYDKLLTEEQINNIMES